MESLKKTLECSICCDLYSEPKTLVSCFHTFCAICLEKYIKKKKFSCPNCAKSFKVPNNDVSQLKTNFDLKNLIDIIKNLQEASNGQNIPCMKHKGESLRVFCQTCCMPVCILCVTSNHSGHKFVEPAEERKCREGELQALKDRISKQVECLTQKNQTVLSKIDELTRGEKDKVLEINKFYSETMQEFKNVQQDAEERVYTITKPKEEALRRIHKQITTDCKSLQNSLSSFEKVINEGSDIEVLILQRALTESISSLVSGDSFCEAIGEELGLPKIHFGKPIMHISVLDDRTASQFDDKRSNTKQSKCTDEIGSLRYSVYLIGANDEKFFPKYTEISWINDESFVTVDSNNHKIIILNILTRVVQYVIVKGVISVSSWSFGIVAKTLSGKIIFFDHSLEKIHEVSNVASLSKTSPCSNTLGWCDKKIIFVQKDLKIDPSRNYLTDSHNKRTSFYNPKFMCILPNKHIVVSDWAMNCILFMEKSGKILRKLKYAPGSICTDSNSNFYVADYYNNEVNVFDPKGSHIRKLSLEQIVYKPRSLSLLHDNLLVASASKIVLVSLHEIF